MANVEFNDENKSSVLYSKFQSSAEVPTLVRWIMATGLAKTPEVANGILLGIAVLAVIITGVIVYKMNSSNTPQLTPAQIQAMQQQMNAPR